MERNLGKWDIFFFDFYFLLFAAINLMIVFNMGVIILISLYSLYYQERSPADCLLKQKKN